MWFIWHLPFKIKIVASSGLGFCTPGLCIMLSGLGLRGCSQQHLHANLPRCKPVLCPCQAVAGQRTGCGDSLQPCLFVSRGRVRRDLGCDWGCWAVWVTGGGWEDRWPFLSSSLSESSERAEAPVGAGACCTSWPSITNMNLLSETEASN